MMKEFRFLDKDFDLLAPQAKILRIWKAKKLGFLNFCKILKFLNLIFYIFMKDYASE